MQKRKEKKEKLEKWKKRIPNGLYLWSKIISLFTSISSFVFCSASSCNFSRASFCNLFFASFLRLWILSRFSPSKRGTRNVNETHKRRNRDFVIRTYFTFAGKKLFLFFFLCFFFFFCLLFSYLALFSFHSSSFFLSLTFIFWALFSFFSRIWKSWFLGSSTFSSYLDDFREINISFFLFSSVFLFCSFVFLTF